MAGQAQVRVKRIYEAPAAGDGTRVLVDRVWPRGVTKAAARLDEWAKDVAPTTELRQWYGHDPARFDEFRARYLEQLRDPPHSDALRRLAQAAGDGPVTLLTATRQVDISAAAVLAERLTAARSRQ